MTLTLQRSGFPDAAASVRPRRVPNLRWAVPYAFLSPLMVLLGLFTFWPLLQTVYLSVMRLSGSGAARFVGWDNYLGVVGSVQFADALWNTGIYLLLSVPLKVILPLPIAVFIWALGGRAAQIHKTILFLPVLLSFVVVSIVWVWMLNPVLGLLQAMIAPFGLVMPALLSQAQTAIHVIIGVGVWKVIGFNVLLYLAGLAAIDRDLIEAMRIDGAGDGVIFRRLILPLLSPTIFFVALSSVMFTVQQVFTPIDVMTQGGPSNATTNLFYLVYQYAFENFNIGFASATTVILFLFLGAVALLKALVVERHVHYR